MSTAQIVLPLVVLVAACKPPPQQQHQMPGADPDAGRTLAERVGCASCHSFPDIRWPKGRVGPDLAGFAGQGMIGGRLPNRPAVLVQFVRNAPALIAGTTMPAMPISEKEARDVAAYLYTLD